MVERIFIPVNELYLDSENPRQPIDGSQEKLISYLCNYERVYQLAVDIAENGLNPLEMLGVLKRNEDGWIALEGNRRACAIKLLSDPMLAPVELRKRFQKLHENLPDKFDEVECVLFKTRKEADIWLDRLHNGEQNGVGRRQWNAIEKQRRYKKPEYKYAMLVFRYAFDQNWINEDDINNKISTASRYLSNEKLRSALGIDNDKDALKRTKNAIVFDELLNIFITDLKESGVNGRVSSRSNKAAIERYAETLLNEYENKNGTDSGARIQCEPERVYKSTIDSKPTSTNDGKNKPKRDRLPEPPKVNFNINKELNKNLKKLNNYKIEALYFSLFKVNINDKYLIPLVTVGAWCFAESLATALGKKNCDFVSFYNNLLKDYEQDKQKRKDITTLMNELSNLGNMTKHNGKSANFNAESLINAMETISPFLTSIIAAYIKNQNDGDSSE